MSEPNDAANAPLSMPGDRASNPAILRPLNWIVAADVFAIMMLTAVDVAGRYVFNAPVPGATFLVATLMGVLIFVALPLATARDEHLRAGLLDHLFRGRAHRIKEQTVLLVSLA